jgi:hypothetical protein
MSERKKSPRRREAAASEPRGSKTRRPEAPEALPPAKTLAKVRTVHGTRVARRIVCSACGASDTIDFAPRDPSKVLCRRCVFEQHNVVDADDTDAKTRRADCARCGKSFEITIRPGKPAPAECPDCRAGIETKQGDRSRGALRVSKKVVRARR